MSFLVKSAKIDTQDRMGQDPSSLPCSFARKR